MPMRLPGAWRYKRSRFATSVNPDNSVSVMMTCMRIVLETAPAKNTRRVGQFNRRPLNEEDGIKVGHR
jgi:hypothetical protein